MVSDKQMTEVLMMRYESRDIDSKLDKDWFKGMFKEGVKAYYPKLKEMYADQSIYGISFEIANIVQSVYAEDFYTIVYFNTEEMFAEDTKDCDEDEKDYYRFEPWAEWDVATAESDPFDKIQDYLKQNSLNLPLDSAHYADGLSEEAAAWYEENENDFEDAFEEECGQIRMWIAEALGELRKEGFWEKQGNAGIYVIPFSGECEITYEEMVETFREMDQGYHGTEYLDYLGKEEM
ncbi:MAG: hypothetical protein K2M91_10555 [Lachnospiraceae bacterium]|nr:hypothetical protein [Lachnospiraceae bacterium]